MPHGSPRDVMVYEPSISRDRRTHPLRYAAQELTTNTAKLRANAAKKLCLQHLPNSDERDMLFERILPTLVG
jgi:hypothetical protein